MIMVRRQPNSSSSRGAGLSPNNPSRPLLQTDLLGVPVAVSDSEAFGHSMPSRPGHNCSIVTFQNIGPQSQFSHTSKSIFNSKSFSKCNASIALLAEHCLHEPALPASHLFSDRLTAASPTATSYLFHNTHEPDAPWNLHGGTGLIIGHNLSSHKTAHGADPSGLGRWSFIQLKGKHGYTISFFSAYRPC